MAGAWLLGAETRATADERPRAVLMAVVQDDRTDEGAPGTPASLRELERLADTDGLTVAETLVQSRDRPDPATYLGSGKAGELAAAVERCAADVVIADGELSPGQARNLQDKVGVPVVDRTALILDIFAGHARTSEGRLQVELAQIAYQLPRLQGAGRSMSRVGGGRVVGGAGMGVRGPGEMRLEIQRRRLRRRAAGLREQVARLGRRRERMQWRRTRNRVPSVAITGYTNAGKSALLNRLSGADALTQDVLFATLDPTVRRVTAQELRFTLTDTVGFVRNLPHQLIEAFRSTLEEVARADLALHVVDASAADALSQISTVHEVLREIGAGQVPEMLVLNKIDVASPETVSALRRVYLDALQVSALTGAGINELRDALAGRLQEREAQRSAGTSGTPSPG
ncbi:GTPase HflX [Actinoplanes friuliensis]|uniref:GTPase HflX n=1 Tax=Actinoplanes friuliensis DSM 7358 TaxID=1246995 RepID=U5VWG3_9ACTN|nr:GTPase HflX [Actinoplanes friuliensis]AGZ41117.1 GTP-binding protein HflX [Actinoplanes friuliensis DSM 7358]